MKIKLIGIKKKYKKILFDKLDLEINDNEMVCIAGKSGSGKTTLLNIIGLIEKPDDGKVYYNEEEIKKDRQRRILLKYTIGFLFQEFGLIENETVYDNFAYIEKVKKMKKKNSLDLIESSMKKLHLSLNTGQKIYELSGGEKQRVALAKLLVKDCDVILADEPTASVDSENKKEILNVLKQMQKNGKTVILVSHDSETIQFCDRVIWI